MEGSPAHGADSRVDAGREPAPTTACIDRQAVRTTERGGTTRGYDGGGNINGRRRHVLVDTLDFFMAIVMTRAGLVTAYRTELLLRP